MREELADIICEAARTEPSRNDESILDLVLGAIFSTIFEYFLDRVSPPPLAPKNDAPPLALQMALKDAIGAPRSAASKETLDRVAEALRRHKPSLSETSESPLNPSLLAHVYEQTRNPCEKRGPRQQAGVFYTPKRTAAFICRQALTAAPRISNDEPINILDPAMGCGEFLVNMLENLTSADAPFEERYFMARDALIHSLHGVDIQEGAVRVARLRLWLALLHLAFDTGEYALIMQTVQEEDVYKALTENIRTTDSLGGAPGALHWTFRKHFHIIVGNPPFVRIQELSAEQRQHLRDNFSLAQGKFDLSILFIEQAAALLHEKGACWFVLPNKFLSTSYGRAVRNFLSDTFTVQALLDFQRLPLFPDASAYVCILGLEKGRSGEPGVYAPALPEDNSPDDVFSRFHQGGRPLPSELLSGRAPHALKNGASTAPLAQVCSHIFQGIISGGDKLLYLLDMGKKKGELRRVKTQDTGKAHWIESALLRPLVMGRDLKRYTPPQPAMLALYPYAFKAGENLLLDEKSLREQAPRAFAYLKARKAELSARGSQRMHYKSWYALWCPRKPGKFLRPKLLTQVLAHRAAFTYDPNGELFFTGGGNAGVYGLLPNPDILGADETAHLYLLALLNSAHLESLVRARSSVFRGGYISFGKTYIADLPIALPEETVKNELADLARQALSAPNPEIRAPLEKMIDERVEAMYL